MYSPVSPDEMDWRTLFPAFYPEKDDKDKKSSKVEFADIGCGYGGLLGNQCYSYNGFLIYPLISGTL